MKKISKMIILSMFLVILTPFFAPSTQAYAGDYEGRTQPLKPYLSSVIKPQAGDYEARVKTQDGSNLNVRSGPGTNYKIVGKFANGTIVHYAIVQDYEDWTWVTGKGTNGKTISGYVKDSYLAAP